MKTQAAILFDINKPLVIKEIEIPRLSPGQVLVKMLYSGICRTQLNEIQGFKGKDNYLPHLLGHEGSGEVVSIGKQVSKVKSGDYVVLSWIKGSGHDTGGTKYLLGTKIINSGPIATFTQYAVVSENRLTKINPIVPPDQAALFGCALATGTGIVLNKLKLSPQSTLVIFGAGGIGTSVILAARMQKCAKILVVDINQKALNFAQKLGAKYTILYDPINIVNRLRSVFPDGADWAVEATGNRQAMETAINSIKNNGTVIIAGNLKTGEKISIDPFDLIKGKKIYGTWGGEADPDRIFAYMATSFRIKKLPLKSIITGKIRLKEINSVFEKMRNYQTFGRALIDFT